MTSIIENNIEFTEGLDLVLEFVKEISYKKSILSQKIIQNKILDCIAIDYINQNGHKSLINYIFAVET